MISYIKCNVWFEKHASDVYICISNIRRLPKSTVKCSEARRENARSKSFLIVLDLIDATLHRRRQNERLNWSEPGFVAPSWVKRYRLFFHTYVESLAKNCLQMSEMPSFDRNFFFLARGVMYCDCFLRVTVARSLCACSTLVEHKFKTRLEQFYNSIVWAKMR